MSTPQNNLPNFLSQTILVTITRWLLLCLIIGILIGTASAGFLISLNWITNFRTANSWLIFLLPLAGFAIGLVYRYWGKDIESGNNVLIETLHQPKRTIPLKMGLFIYLSTLTTHLFGGSAGREGTALQMAGSIADQFSKPFKLSALERQILVTASIAGGFGAVFGTPIAGAVFGLEVFLIRRLRYQSILPAVIAALIANFVCRLWGAPHTHYHIHFIPPISAINILSMVLAGVAFGLTALCFTKSTHWLGDKFKSSIGYAPLRPLIGGFSILGLYLLVGTDKYLGLGIPTISASFNEQLNSYDFALKLIFTVVTLASGFKGGEVTPLFFIGAALGNTLSLVIPLPMALLAGMGFVAVFSGATNTPIACTVMAMELFGLDCAIYAAIACIVAFLVSGNGSIYNSVLTENAKFHKYKLQVKKELENL